MDGPEWARGLHLDGPLWAPDHQFYGPKWAQANSWYDCHDVCKTMRAECRGSYATIVARYWMNGNNRGLSSDKIRCCWLFDIYGISISPYLYLSLSLSISVYISLSLSIYLFLSLSLSVFVGRPMNNSGQICIKRASTSSLMA